jgi:hypothetical protein
MKSDIWSPLGHGRFLIIFSNQDLHQTLALQVPVVNRFLAPILDQTIDPIRDQILASRGPFLAQLSDTDSCKKCSKFRTSIRSRCWVHGIHLRPSFLVQNQGQKPGPKGPRDGG